MPPEPPRDPRPSESSAEQSHNLEPMRRHRAIVWSLIVLASLLLVLSITANWIDGEVLDTDRVVDTTNEILAEPEVQKSLATYTVDQLYANVDVQRELQERLPAPVRGLAAPAAAAVRPLALDLQRRALASTRVQDLTSSAIRLSHEQFIGLITNQREYISSAGGEVTLEYGPLIADLASRLGVSADTISRVQEVVRGSENLEPRLTELQAKIESARAALARVEQGQLNPEMEQRLSLLQDDAATARGKLASLDNGVETAQAKVPPRLQARLAQLDERLANLDRGLTAAGQRISAALSDPSAPRVEALDAQLGDLQARLTALQGRQLVQTPGQLVVMKSTQLEGVQALVRALRSLAFVLPLLVLLLYAGALYLARGWRPQALLAAGGGILVAALLVRVASRLIGDAVVGSVAVSGAVEPTVRSVWEILSEGLRERTLFVLVIGLAFVGAGLLAGPSRRAAALRGKLAPHLRDRPLGISVAVALLFLLWLAFAPGIHLGQVLTLAALAALAMVGIEALRRQTGQEFPPAGSEGS